MPTSYWTTLTAAIAVGFVGIAVATGGYLLFGSDVLAQTNTGGPTGSGSNNGSPNASSGPPSGTNQDAQGQPLNISIPSAGTASGADAGTNRASDNPPLRAGRGVDAQGRHCAGAAKTVGCN